ncbi:sensor histidine kinase [Plantactinospora soyae]|uniref:Signal transduction histidine kinase n=1 Tax=Plantactinospora soyae TaxID=1544732 RepID=A0A927MC99_9ACTN|nr:sensor histidine kinase [Plantactinospora soyae]MBE1492093.1 signal transduction histidine kinase [Plantactinospora soyae]
MIQRPRRGDPFWIWTLHWWDVLSWALLALLILLTVVGDLPATARYGSLALMVGLGLCYATTRRSPGNPVLTPQHYLGLLVLVLGGLAYLRDGFGVLYTVLLPQFTILARNTRSAIVYSGLGAVAITIGGVLRQGWTLDVLTTNTISSLAVYAASVLITVLTPLGLRQAAERAQLRADLTATELRLAEAQKRQGAAEERERLAREIHDTLAQGFASIIVLAEAARAGLGSRPDKSAQQLQSIEQTARENLAEARILVGSAPQSGLAAGSVARTLRRTLDRFAEDTGLTVTADLPDIDVDQPTRIALLRCTQESLANIRKHAAASTVGVVLTQHQDRAELEITDDGQGFVVADSHGFGLDGMRKRLAELGGELTVTSSVGNGTRVLAMLPTNGQV